jgi:hypothetical protein
MGPSLVHYDFVGEDGLLAGGKVTLDLSMLADPTASDRTLMHFPYEAVRSHGPSDNRIDLVIVGDGYTEAELPLYRESVDHVVDAFFGSEALADYEAFFNVYRVDVISKESGVDHDPRGQLRDTALDSGYDCGGVERLLCVNMTKALGAAHSVPAVDQVLVVVNSEAYGGAGYPRERLSAEPQQPVPGRAGCARSQVASLARP